MGFFRHFIETSRIHITRNKKESDAWMVSGLAKKKQGDYVGAINDYSRAIEFDPVSPVGYANRAIAKSLSGDYQGAIDDRTKELRQFSLMDTRHNFLIPIALIHRAECLVELGMYSEAVNDFHAASQFDPNDPRLISAINKVNERLVGAHSKSLVSPIVRGTTATQNSSPEKMTEPKTRMQPAEPLTKEISLSTFLDSLGDQKNQKLLEWRQRYTRVEYPFKVAQNLLYEALTIQKLWPEFRKSFQTIGVDGEREILTSFQEAHNYIYVRRRQVQTSEIQPLVAQAYNSTTAIPRLNFATFRQRVSEAQNGNHKMMEEIEFAYFFHTAAYEMIYGWAAAGLMGYDEQKAYHSITPAVFEGLDFNSLDLMIHAFGQSASMVYRPLPPL